MVERHIPLFELRILAAGESESVSKEVFQRVAAAIEQRIYRALTVTGSAKCRFFISAIQRDCVTTA
ncbi:hypothetical protein D3C80_1955400 [compost metagenome]